MSTQALRPSDELRAWVGARASRLQHSYRADEPGAVRQLAMLRRVQPGGFADPEVWAVLADLPSSLAGSGDLPSVSERAAYDALVLFAVQQQGHREQDLHVPGRRLGQALQRLRVGDVDRDPIVRRFKQLGTAGTYESSVRHLRGLLTQLRGGSGTTPVGLDFGRLATDLVWLQQPSNADRVRLVWGRDFYRTPAALDPENPASPPSSEGEQL